MTASQHRFSRSGNVVNRDTFDEKMTLSRWRLFFLLALDPRLRRIVGGRHQESVADFAICSPL
jgi:hypothetical protein